MPEWHKTRRTGLFVKVLLIVALALPSCDKSGAEAGTPEDQTATKGASLERARERGREHFTRAWSAAHASISAEGAANAVDETSRERASARPAGISKLTDDCRRDYWRLHAKFRTLPDSCEEDADCTMTYFGCLGERCGGSVKEGAEATLESIRKAHDELREKCGPCADAVVSCPSKTPKCLNGTCIASP